MKVEITNTLLKYTVKHPQRLQSVLETASALTSIADVPAGRKEQTVNIILVGEKRIRRLNKEFLRHDYPTDVIAFTYHVDEVSVYEQDADDEVEDDALFGELFVCPGVAEKRRYRYKTSLSYEILLYIVHGMLHLAGYDDDTETRRAEMKAVEGEVMNKLTTQYEIDDLFMKRR